MLKIKWYDIINNQIFFKTMNNNIYMNVQKNNCIIGIL